MGSIGSYPAPEGENLPERGPVSGESIDQLNVPVFSSRPGASRKLYLDFNGHNSIDNWSGWWEFGGHTAGPTPAYDIDDDQTSYSYQEKVNIEKIWKGVAEKFSPFDLDVTTVIPASRSPGSSATVIIGGDGAWLGYGGGVAQSGGFNEDFFDGNAGNYAFVWSAPDNPTYMAEAVAHEAGHMFNLYHQSFAPIADNEYAPGFIMGSGDATTYGRWGNTAVSGSFSTRRDDDGVYIARSSQDDLAILSTNNGFGYRADDFGSSIPTATTLSLASVNGILSASTAGVLTPSDSDVIKIVHSGGSFEAEVLSAEFRAMLDPQMTLTTSTGNTVSFSNTDNGSDGKGEKITVNSLAAGTYLLWINSEGGYGNIGQWRLSVRAGTGSTAPNNTISSALTIGLQGDTGATGVGLGFGGNGTVLESVQSSDTFDFFKVRLPQHVRQFFAQISGMSSSVELQLIDDANGNHIVDTGEVLSTSAGGTATQALTLGSAAVAEGDIVYIRTRNVGGGNSNYTLKLSADVGQPTLPPTAASSFYDPQPYHGGYTVYDSIMPAAGDTVDYYRVTPEFNGQIGVAMSETGGNVVMAIGNDLNSNGVIDSGEFLYNGATDFVESVNVTANAKILVRCQGSVEANYNVFVMLDYPTSGNANGTLTPNFTVPAGNSGTFNEYLGYLGDFYDSFKFNPVAGLFHAKLAMTDSFSGGAHRLQIIKDTNTNGTVDAGEIVADGFGELTFNITEFANYYMRVLPQIVGEFGTTGNYRLSWWMGNAVEPAGSSPSPINPGPGNQTLNGFLGYNALEPALRDTEDRFTFTLGTRTRFDVSINNALFGLQILQQNGNVLQRIVGVGTNQGTIGSLSANLDPGTYVVRAYLPMGEGQANSDQTIGGDYTLSYKTAAITDNSPPLVSASGFQYEVKSTGIYFDMNQDVAGSINLSDASVIGLDSGFTFPLRQTHYDPATHTVGFDFQAPVLPDGRYRATLAAGSLKDLSNNPLANAYTFDFYVLSGDFNRDQVVNFDDLLRLAQNYGRIDTATFSMGDANYDRSVDFDDLLILAQQYGSSLFSSNAIVSSPVKKERMLSDVLV
jgi:hypothetical protein